MMRGNFEHTKTILWDWNGTLLNDVDICVDIINGLLRQRGHEVLSKARYRQIFTFPVKAYYEAAGFRFDIDPFESVAVEFMDTYRQKLSSAQLFPEVIERLKYFKAKGVRQYVVSAMEHDFLMDTLKDKNIRQFFDGVSGIHNDLAHGKLNMALRFVKEKSIDVGQAVFIGDTLHDHEVATALGTPCLLIASGHQSYERLNINGNDVVHSLNEINLE